MEECCANCLHNKYNYKYNWQDKEYECGNEDSEVYGLPTQYSDYCSEYEEK